MGYPRRAPRTGLSGYTPNSEAIAKYHPDLVLISYNPGNFASQLRKLGIKTVLEPAANDLPHAYGEILQLGRLTGHTRGAKTVVHLMQKHLAAIIRSVPKSRRHLRVFHELSPDYYSATSATFIGRVYKLFGFTNIADAADATHTGYPQLSGEYILSANPQLVVLSDSVCCGQTTGKVAVRPGWQQVAAVRQHRVVAVDDSIASRWGPRLIAFAQTVAAVARKSG